VRAVEQLVDLQTTSEVFRGEELTVTTARALRHALLGPDRVACGLEDVDLAPSARPWQAGRLSPELRCKECERLVPGGTGYALPFEFEQRSGSADEQKAAAALLEALAPFDVSRWIFTDLVIIDDSIRGGMSHPLTIAPKLVLRRQHSALTTFLHEQLHWLMSAHPSAGAASAEARERWPVPPPSPAGGMDAPSTWMHMSVCALEYQSLSALVGREAAEAELRAHAGYSWIYSQILDDPQWFEEYFTRHNIALPNEPPIPRRYVGDGSWARSSLNS
jgi:hypothetical protein